MREGKHPMQTKRQAMLVGLGAAAGLGGLALGAGAIPVAADEADDAATAGETRTYVLVHGAWFGGWVWRDVAPALRALGHEVWTPTLTGLGERKHLAGSGYDLNTHVQDVVALIEMEDLRDVHLVGWSYGGMVTTGVLARVPDRIASMIYLDAFVPEDGKSLNDYAGISPSAAPLEPLSFEAMAFTDAEAIAFAEPRVTVQDSRTFSTPVEAIPRPDIPFTYVRFTRFGNPMFDQFLAEFEAAGHATHEIDSGHIGMLDHVPEVVELLANVE